MTHRIEFGVREPHRTNIWILGLASDLFSRSLSFYYCLGNCIMIAQQDIRLHRKGAAKEQLNQATTRYWAAPERRGKRTIESSDNKILGRARCAWQRGEDIGQRGMRAAKNNDDDDGRFSVVHGLGPVHQFLGANPCAPKTPIRGEEELPIAQLSRT